MTQPSYRIGTSGWNYKHWKERFYPPGLKSADWLRFYAGHFDTVELNVTFYRGVRAATFEKWARTVPDGFLFSLKLSRFITHLKRLNVDRESIDRFIADARPLGEKLGIVLIQLPPSLKYDGDLLARFFSLLDPGVRYAIEPRNPTFLDERFFRQLRELNIAWCISSSAGRYPYLEAATADFVYLRLHGGTKLYGSEYGEDEIRGMAAMLRRLGKNGFVYFNNDANAFAVKNAGQLKALLP